MKRRYVLSVFLIVLVLAASAPFAGATAVMTSTEKENKYTAAILNLESYLESYGDTSISLLGIEEEFSQLRGYEQSRQLMNYTKILSKIEQEEFDYDLTRLLLSLDDNKVFKAYLADVLKGSPISTVEDLKTYTAGRKCEKEGQVEEAIRYYTECLNYFDADIRRDRLSLGQTNAAYDRAVTLLIDGDFAGAYYEFEKISDYNDSKEYQDFIVKLIGYKPASAMDNPEAVGVINMDAGSDYIELSWARPAHVTRYRVGIREQDQTAWTMKECYEDSIHWDGLAPETVYDFQVIAVSGEAEMAPAWIEVMTRQRVTPSPTPTPTPTPKPTPSPTPTLSPTPTPTPAPTRLPTSGSFSDHLTWEYDHGLLYIAGEGRMRDFEITNRRKFASWWNLPDTPWSVYQESIKTVVISDGVTSIGANSFYYSTSLTNITIPDSVTSIGDSAFCGCWSLDITIPNGVTIIGESAFQNCSALTSIKIPDGVTSIGHMVFERCTALTSIKIPDGVTSIGNAAFSGCRALTSITIPKSVTSIGHRVFERCTALTSIKIPDGVTSIGNYAFYECSALTSIAIPDGVTSIGDYAFNGCSSLTSITIPDGVTSIGDYAFWGCSSLTSITIPDGVTSIGDYAFSSCTSLTSIIVSKGSYAEEYCKRNHWNYKYK